MQSNFIRLLYDDYDELVCCNYNIIIIKLLSPKYFGAVKKDPDNSTIKNSYLIIQCAKQKYQLIGHITDFIIEYNKFNECTYIFIIKNDPTNTIKFYMSIKSLYFFDSFEKYNEYKIYFETQIENAKSFNLE
jgi:hypothetical protein